MIPGINTNQTISIMNQPTSTFKLDSPRVKGLVDGLEAVKQAVLLILSVNRYEYPIFSWNYGVELGGLIGAQKSYALPEAERRIREALLQDDRITGVNSFSFTEIAPGKCLIKFNVVTEFGDFESEVSIDV